MSQNYLKFLVSLLCVALTFGECPKTIKYSVATFKETENFQDAVISPQVEAYIITLQENLPTVCKGMLNITKKSSHLYAYRRNIEEIEVGAFENQNLQGQLFLSENKLSVIKKGTFRNMLITELDLSYNQIAVMEEGAIQDLPNLSTLSLSRNKIKHFYPNSITNTPNLLFFGMSVNKMETLQENHFSFMSKKRNVGISVASNELKEIHPKAFEGIDVFTLNISDNKLTSIPKEVFSENKLSLLHIENNKLTHLDDEFFKMDTVKLRNVDLEGNNFDEETVKKLEPFMKIIMENRKEDQRYHHH